MNGPVVRAVVVDHVSIRVRDLEASRRFYEAALAPLGFGVVSAPEGGTAFGLEGADDFWILEGGEPSKRVHVAFAAPDRAAVDAFYHAALEAGATMDPPVSAPSTTPATTPPSCSTRTATTSKLCTTSRGDSPLRIAATRRP